MSNLTTTTSSIVVGGVDTHKELHVVAVVDAHDRVIGTESFSTTRAGYRALVRWMRTYGDIARVGVECTGSYGAGLMRHPDTAGIDVLEVTAGDKVDRRKRGKDDTIDAEQAAHAAYARVRTVTPRAHNGMVESLRALKIARSSAISGHAGLAPADPRHHHLRPRRTARPAAEHDPHAADPHPGFLAP